jgi:hypothetical protein
MAIQPSPRLTGGTVTRWAQDLRGFRGRQAAEQADAVTGATNRMLARS